MSCRRGDLLWIDICILVFTFCFLISSFNAEVIKFKDVQFPEKGNEYYLVEAALWSPQDAPSKLWPGTGQSYVKFDATFSGEINETQPVDLEILVFALSDQDAVGFKNETVKKTQLCVDGKVYIQENTEARILHKAITFPQTKSVLVNFDVTKTDIHVLIFAKCREADAPIHVNGMMIAMNPYGQLPGQSYGILPFYGILTIAYLVVGIVWGVANIIHWRDLLKLQLCISAVLMLSLVESGVQYFDYFTYNINGTRAAGLVSFGLIFTLGRKTLARILVLIVSMGFGVVKPTLGSTSYAVIMYGCLYFVASCLSKIAELLYDKDQLPIPLLVLMIVPLSLVDGGFYVWIFMSLSKTIMQLDKRRQMEKLALYNRFKWTLVLYVLASGAWIFYELYFRWSGAVATRWQTLWTLDAYWEILFFIVFCTIMFLWRPTKNNTRYAYSQLSTENGAGGADDFDSNNEPLDLDEGEEMHTQHISLGAGPIKIRTTTTQGAAAADDDDSASMKADAGRQQYNFEREEFTTRGNNEIAGAIASAIINNPNAFARGALTGFQLDDEDSKED